MIHPYDMYIKIYGRLPTERDPRYLELVRMTKYRVTEVVDTQPGKCANCGASRTDGRKYIDFGVHVEFYGDIIFCSICVGDMARNLGLFRAQELQILQLEQKIAELQGRTDLTEELKNTVLITYEQIRELFDGRTDSPDSNVTSNSSDFTNSNNVPSSERTVSSTDSESSKSGSAKPELRTTQSTTKSRSANVPSLAKLIGSDSQ